LDDLDAVRFTPRSRARPVTREISSTSSAEYRRVCPSVREGLINPFFSYMRRVCGWSLSMSATTPIM
jgi:hypothetical protein